MPSFCLGECRRLGCRGARCTREGLICAWGEGRKGTPVYPLPRALATALGAR